MTRFLLCAALALSGSLDTVLDQVDQESPEIRLSARLVPSRLDPDVVWLPEELGVQDGGHWIPPLRLGITEKASEQGPVQFSTDFFCWSETLDRDYFLPTSGQFVRQRIPFQISLEVEASGGQSLSLQMELSTTVVNEPDAKSPARYRVRKRSAQGRMLSGQTLVITNLYPFEEVLPILGDLPVLGPLFQPSSTGPMLLLRTES
ncbi:hypothetical protein JST97_38535 [bacterium]|nr:hypothetical protein [bacterium]